MGKIDKLKVIDKETNRPTNTDLYPVTSTKAVYDENNRSLDEILKTLVPRALSLNTEEVSYRNNSIIRQGEHETIFAVGIGNGIKGDPYEKRNAIEITKTGDVYIVGIGGYNGVSLEGAKSLKDVLNTK